MEIRLSETFTGDIDGESPVRALQVLRDDKSASLVSMQRFRGKLGGRQGTFVLQGSEIVENGKIKATWFVVPGSGQVIFPGCAARAALKVSLEKGPTDGWIIGSNDAATTPGHGCMKSLAHTPHCRPASERLAKVCLPYTQRCSSSPRLGSLRHRLVFALVPRLLLHRP